MKPDPQTFRRGQVEWALWRLFDIGTHARRDMPAAFRTRIKRLLDIDREAPPAHGAARFAFADEAPDGTGSEAAFTAFDVACLALGLDLLDMGFKQAEVVFLLRHIRDALRGTFARVARDYPPANRQRYRVSDYPNCPALKSAGGSMAVDPGVFLLVGKVELTELAPAKTKGPIISPPEICFGQAELAAALAKLGPSMRKVLVVEVGVSARTLPRLLEAAPVVKRGRPG